MSGVPSEFSISDDEAIEVFSDYEERAQTSSQKFTFGEEQKLDIPTQGNKLVKLVITFMSPLEETKRRGYRFGERPGTTADDRAEMIRLLKKKMNQYRKEVSFSGGFHRTEQCAKG